MACVTKFSYGRLRQDVESGAQKGFRRARSFSGFRRFSFRRRLKLRIPGLTRFQRKRARFFSRVKVSWGKALKRLKKGQAHMNDLFGGNFLVMQVNPSPFGCDKPFMGHHVLHGLPPRCPPARTA